MQKPHRIANKHKTRRDTEQQDGKARETVEPGLRWKREERERVKKTRGYGFHETDISTYMVRSNVNSYSHKHHIPHHSQITTANYSYSKSLFIACESQCFSLLFSRSRLLSLELVVAVFLGHYKRKRPNN